VTATELAASHPGAARERTVRWHEVDATALQGRSGLEALVAIRDGATPPPPMAALLGMRIVSLEHGRVVFECDVDSSTDNPLGVTHGGLVCTLADTVCGCAVHSTLPEGTSYTSIDLSVQYLRPVTAASGTLRATGVATKVGRRVAFAEASIVDASGAQVAAGVSSLLVIA